MCRNLNRARSLNLLAPQVFLKNIKIISPSWPASRMCFRIKLDDKCDSSLRYLPSCWAQLYSALGSLTYLSLENRCVWVRPLFASFFNTKWKIRGLHTLGYFLIHCYDFWVEMMKLLGWKEDIEKNVEKWFMMLSFNDSVGHRSNWCRFCKQ